MLVVSPLQRGQPPVSARSSTLSLRAPHRKPGVKVQLATAQLEDAAAGKHRWTPGATVRQVP